MAKFCDLPVGALFYCRLYRQGPKTLLIKSVDSSVKDGFKALRMSMRKVNAFLVGDRRNGIFAEDDSECDTEIQVNDKKELLVEIPFTKSGDTISNPT